MRSAPYDPHVRKDIRTLTQRNPLQKNKEGIEHVVG